MNDKNALIELACLVVMQQYSCKCIVYCETTCMYCNILRYCEITKKKAMKIVLNKLMDTISQNCVKFSYKKMCLVAFSGFSQEHFL